MNTERRLTAVFAAEALTVGDSNNRRMEVWAGILSNYKTALASQIKNLGGNVIGRSHTAILAEFDTIVHAVDCSLKFQKSVLVRNRSLPSENRVFFRLGLHVGEIILGGDALTGHGVQIATQLVSNAVPGGILISGQAYDLIANLKSGFEQVSETQNYDFPSELRVYAKLPGENLYNDNKNPDSRMVSAPSDVTLLDLNQQLSANEEDTTIIGDPQHSNILTTGEASPAPSAQLISEIEMLLKQTSKPVAKSDYYSTLQQYDKIRKLADNLKHSAPEQQTFYLKQLSESTRGLEKNFAFKGDAVIKSSNGSFILRIASNLELGRGVEGANVGCRLVSRNGRQTRLSIEKSLFQITELGSTNGTYQDNQCLQPNEPLIIPPEQESQSIYLGGSRSPPTPGPVHVTMTQLRGEYLALLVRFSPNKSYSQSELSAIWPSMVEDCSVTYVLSNGPILIGNSNECAVQLTKGVENPLARLELDNYYTISPQGNEPLNLNHINFERSVVISDATNIEIQGQKFDIYARMAAG